MNLSSKYLLAPRAYKRHFSHNQFTKDIVQIQYGFSAHMHASIYKDLKLFNIEVRIKILDIATFFHAQMVAHNKEVGHFV